MELKDIIEGSRQKIIDAHNAFYADHPEVAKKYLVEAHNLLQLVSPEPDITEISLEGLRDKERAAQDSAGNEPIVILSFEEHIKRIEYLADQTLIKFQAEKLEGARESLIHISIHNNQALQQLDELVKLQQHIDDGSEV